MKISLTSARQLARDILAAQQVPADIADDVAEHLVESDRCGYISHGLSILPNYRTALDGHSVNPQGRAKCVLDQGTLMVFDGDGGFGQHVGKSVMQAAIERVRQHGHCIVTLRRSHHLGRMGHYGEMAAAAGFVLLSFTNVINRAPVVAPFGGRVARLTTNPLCFAGPMPNGRPPLVVDIATSAIAINKARVLAEKGEPAPEGSIIGADGNPTTDASTMFGEHPGALLPFGGHKGYALGVVAELLAGVLSGGGTIQPDNPRGGVATNNLFAVLLNPALDLGLDWQSAEVEAFVRYLHDTPPAPGVDRVQYPGEYEAANRAQASDTLNINPAIWRNLERLAQSLNVAVPTA
ncbi:L-lactate dehydrogenase [Cupriavidus necator]|uniref:L-lactate dehydrogenase n=2 Tax=Cupriavidus necator (strain ATCC 17699 / DSM 428 / KCTC 22496 / NCIMB 10442 / H16 / Stanier 337) TaxID=381666 RepID=LDH_CUPNH|nr:Ldh family oxidoreductase [Cupriavidus necator]Q07251.1 RecName: Full=L-lactate dehydrogenase [Cupriavidus necator H16]QCB99744.1 Ldh family oxidoreductase [Cupriavidus necator H16]QQB77439.1 Ldh family oxidoreductase [Cupriavidus necator]WKA41586.1 Ldh family oxidoreductase [Cupriavidus necator]CAA80432.1 lactate dehydrogenase [Cupriavidus necator H16]CAJ91814.1 L-Lactate dehydrogenase [Cupriavidus necator H16]